MTQQSGKTSIQTRNLKDIMVTTTPNLVFELVIFLYISLIILSLSILILPMFTLPCFCFSKPLISTMSPLCSICPLMKLRGPNFFVRWVDCNTPFPEYVLSCVFSFSIVFFDLLPVLDQFQFQILFSNILDFL